MHELYLSPNGTTLQYTMTMPPIRLEHVQYMILDPCNNSNGALGGIVNNWTRTIITKNSILDIARVLDPHLQRPYEHFFYIIEIRCFWEQTLCFVSIYYFLKRFNRHHLNYYRVKIKF